MTMQPKPYSPPVVIRGVGNTNLLSPQMQQITTLALRMPALKRCTCLSPQESRRVWQQIEDWRTANVRRVLDITQGVNTECN